MLKILEPIVRNVAEVRGAKGMIMATSEIETTLLEFAIESFTIEAKEDY